MRRAVERSLEDPLAEEILKGTFHDGDPIQVSSDNEKLTFSQKASAEGALSS
jgi:ATP-dependent Clp protease ATP-binding subunit ClpA